ncbi:ATPase, partial [Pseudomonas sp. HMWF007]
VFIVSPEDGATVSQEFKVKFGTKDVALAPAGDVTKNTGHHHLLIDVDKLPAAGAPIPNDANHMHFGKAQTEATIKLAPGKHTLQLELGDSGHMPFDPPIVSKKITVNVE